MNRKSATSWRQRRPAFTLVEAVVGMALLGTILVAAVTAGVRANTQSRAADLRLEACRAADECLNTWWPDRENFPRSGAGDLQGHAGWTWRTRPVANADAAAIRMAVVALDILAPGQAPDRPALTVEVVLPIPEDKNAAQGTNAG
jgi:hypothetical protein